MSTALHRLIGISVAHAGPVEDYLHIGFSDGSNLSVFNRYALVGRSENTRAIVGTQLSAVDEQQQKVVFLFSSGHRLEVDMTDAGFTGPEAMALVSPGHPIVVWP